MTIYFMWLVKISELIVFLGVFFVIILCSSLILLFYTNITAALFLLLSCFVPQWFEKNRSHYTQRF